MSNFFFKDAMHIHTSTTYVFDTWLALPTIRRRSFYKTIFGPREDRGKSTELVKRWPAVPNIGRVSEMARSCINQERARSASGFIGGHLTVHEHCVHLTNDTITQRSHNSAPSTPPNTTDNTDSRAQHRATDGMLN